MIVKIEPIRLQEIEYRLAALEERFGVPTSDFLEAFRNGHLRETTEFREWAMLDAAREIAIRRHREQ